MQKATRQGRSGEFYSVAAAALPIAARFHHETLGCSAARNIPIHEMRSGTGGYELCPECARIKSDGKTPYGLRRGRKLPPG